MSIKLKHGSITRNSFHHGFIEISNQNFTPKSMFPPSLQIQNFYGPSYLFISYFTVSIFRGNMIISYINQYVHIQLQGIYFLFYRVHFRGNLFISYCTESTLRGNLFASYFTVSIFRGKYKYLCPPLDKYLISVSQTPMKLPLQVIKFALHDIFLIF